MGHFNQYNPTPETRIPGVSYTQTETDISGNAKTTAATTQAGEDIVNDVMKVEERFANAYISTATTTVVKTGGGVLHAITLGETAAGSITIYDNTAGSGTIIAVLKASIVEQTFIFDVAFATGLTVVTAGASKLNVSYR